MLRLGEYLNILTALAACILGRFDIAAFNMATAIWLNLERKKDG